MIRTLHIENYALIEALDMDWHSGFSVITGETGAGKSIILGALALLTGARADTRAVMQGRKRCVVEATLDAPGTEALFEAHDLDWEEGTCVVRRELTAAGKSRAFVNDTPVQLPVLREIVGELIDIHSQHQNLLLGKEAFQTQVLDQLGGAQEPLAAYAQTYKAWRDTGEALREAEAAASRQGEEEDYLRFQCEQLAAARLEAGEQETLEAEATLLEHAAEIQSALSTAATALQGDGMDALTLLRQAEQALQGIGHLYPAAQAMAERIAPCRIELKDIADDLAAQADGIECSGERLEAVNERLSLIYSLEKKHRVDSVEELLALQAHMQAQLDSLGDSEERILALRERERQLRAQAEAQAEVLSLARRQAAQALEAQMGDLLRPMGMPHARFAAEVDFHPSQLGSTGADSISFLLAANKNAPLQDIGRVASGGEIARVMLCLKSLLHQGGRTIIFDEIDTGVSGQIAERMAHLMACIAHGGQVVSITHLPQIAAAGVHHYKVYKEDCSDHTATCIKELTPEERVVELAHMLSGETLTEAALDNARALINQHNPTA